MTINTWDSFFVVGYGRHAKSRIIPALKKNNQKISGIVSSSSTFPSPDIVFSDIESSFKASSLDTVYILCSPPQIHFKQASLILQSGRSVIIEKPAFLSLKEASLAIDLVRQKDLDLIEAFMYKHTRLYKNFISFWDQHKPSVKNIYINFFIPDFPKSTFREKMPIFEAILFDIGCYPISLLVELFENCFDFHNLNISFESNDHISKTIKISMIINKINVLISIGIANSYQNNVEIEVNEKGRVRFSPFFYGQAVDKSISYELENNTRIDNFNDINGFEAMFQTKSSDWEKSKEIRFKKIIKSVTIMEEFSKQLASFDTKSNFKKS